MENETRTLFYGSPNLGQTTRSYDSQQQKQQQKRTYRIADYAILAYFWVKIKENEKKDKYPDLARQFFKKYGTRWWQW